MLAQHCTAKNLVTDDLLFHCNYRFINHWYMSDKLGLLAKGGKHYDKSDIGTSKPLADGK